MVYHMFQLDAVEYKDVASNSKSFSSSEIQYHLFVRIDPNLAHEFELYQVDEIREKAELAYDRHLWEHDPGRIWYRFRSSMLNMQPGYHIYRMSLVSTRTHDTLVRYFAYVIQSNDPYKPYDYMTEHRKYLDDEKD